MEFTKYHGTGNDFIILEEAQLGGATPEAVAKALCHRQFGIGADGLMVVHPSSRGAVRMAYYNQDGSVAPMCGNGLRCFARHVHETGSVREDRFQVETLAGILPVSLEEGYGAITIGLGMPRFVLHPPDVEKEAEFLEEPVTVHGRTYKVSALFLGTLHATVFTGEAVPEEDAKALCHHPLFPRHINVNFIHVKSRDHIKVRTYERGVGWTLSCGTGVAASQVMAHHLGYTEADATVEVPGGILTVAVGGHPVRLTGPAEKIAKGVFYHE